MQAGSCRHKSALWQLSALVHAVAAESISPREPAAQCVSPRELAAVGISPPSGSPVYKSTQWQV